MYKCKSCGKIFDQIVEKCECGAEIEQLTDFEVAKIEFDKIIKDFGKELTEEEIKELVETAKGKPKEYYKYPYYPYYYYTKDLEEILKKIKDAIDKLKKKEKSDFNVEFKHLSEEELDKIAGQEPYYPYYYYYYPYYYYYYYQVQLKDILNKLLDALLKVLEQSNEVDFDDLLNKLIANEDLMSAIPAEVVELIKKYIAEGMKPTDAVKKAWEEYKKKQEEQYKDYPELKKAKEDLEKEVAELKDKIVELQKSSDQNLKATSKTKTDTGESVLGRVIDWFAFKSTDTDKTDK
jgi:hypothetical protein